GGGGRAGSRPAAVVERFLTAPPTPVPPEAVAEAVGRVRAAVEREQFPGGAVAVGNRDLVQEVAVFGRTRWDEDAPPVDPDSTLYDLASLTKAVATAAAVMALVEDGRMELDAPVRRYLPEFSGGAKDSVTVRQLLTHTGGVRAGAVEIRGETPAAVRRYLLGLSLALSPRQDVLYSDLGFIVLWLAAERTAGEPLPRYLQRRVWGPLGMESTRVGVPRGCPRCAPTLHLEQRNEPYTGGSYDEVARRLDGVAGNAGTFSTVRDVARFAAMIANEGRLGDARVFRRRTVQAFTRPQPGAGTRALGWEVYCREGVVPDQDACEEVYAFGHTGVTGTSLWIAPETRSWVVLLTNRTYLPRAEMDVQAFRRRLFETVTAEEQ
ncbi:MAG TPA: serine hydrolase domain-containing protein, partial [Longimicrobiaceae bacterium]|nr:serine hydrolase domain-containing protein [Longimicrobiaceae bacterium]